MRDRFFRLTLCLSCLLVATPSRSVRIQTQEALVNSKDGSYHDFPLGALEATGRLQGWGKGNPHNGRRQGGAAETGGLKVGDRVMMIRWQDSGRLFKKTDTGLEGPQALLGNSWIANRLLPNRFFLRVRRESEQLNLSIDLPKSPSFSFSRPLACQERIPLAEIARHLVEVQEKNGRWKPGVEGDARRLHHRILRFGLARQQ